jgi:hypothetical protein
MFGRLAISVSSDGWRGFADLGPNALPRSASASAADPQQSSGNSAAGAGPG